MIIYKEFFTTNQIIKYTLTTKFLYKNANDKEVSKNSGESGNILLWLSSIYNFTQQMFKALRLIINEILFSVFYKF